MTPPHFFLSLVILLVLSACDTPFDVFYEVVNATGNDVRIEARYADRDIYQKDKNVVFVIPSGETARVYSDGGVGGKDYVPEDRHAYPENATLPPFEKFDVYVGDILLSDSIRHRDCWEYTAKKRVGVYQLRIEN
jgi:hypothetical protein